MSDTIESLKSQLREAEEKVSQLSKQLVDATQLELKTKPLLERLVFAASARCPCGHGLAYDPCFEDPNSVFKGSLSGYWDCSAILLGTADKTLKHTDKLPFAFYEIRSEGQPSANGATTRPKPETVGT